VIYNHASGFFLFGDQEPGGLLYRLELCLSISCKFAVPVFFAISGALMLNREMALGKRFLFRVAKMALTLAVFSVLSYMAEVLQGRAALDVKVMLFRLYEDNLNFSYWYLYAYLAFLMIAPLLGVMVRGLKNRELCYMLALGFIARFALPAFETWRWAGAHHLNPDLSLVCISCDMVLYPTLGYFLHHRLSVKDCRRYAPALILGAALGVWICMEMTLQAYYRTWVPKVEPVTELAAPLLGAAVFASARALLGEWEPGGKLSRLLAYAGGLTFGIYLIHVPVLHSDAMIAVMSAIRAALPQAMMCVSLIEVLLTFGVCALIAMALKRIPGIRSLL
jgi:surface polysaccharide O-acyltransferase-like enzyme